ncbi:uncharacterized protein LOC114579099, partial [Dendrobium catenatum]|uniref:uncharacterized protein LOC114579099 n=1 Tax=Dendrobium catenatum TaxID=906689 RepID=UPI0010A02F8C
MVSNFYCFETVLKPHEKIPTSIDLSVEHAVVFALKIGKSLSDNTNYAAQNEISLIIKRPEIEIPGKTPNFESDSVIFMKILKNLTIKATNDSSSVGKIVMPDMKLLFWWSWNEEDVGRVQSCRDAKPSVGEGKASARPGGLLQSCLIPEWKWRR